MHWLQWFFVSRQLVVPSAAACRLGLKHSVQSTELSFFNALKLTYTSSCEDKTFSGVDTTGPPFKGGRGMGEERRGREGRGRYRSCCSGPPNPLHEQPTETEVDTTGPPFNGGRGMRDEGGREGAAIVRAA